MDQPIETPERPDVIAVSRVTFNYTLIAITFLLLGLVLGAIGYERFAQGNAALVEQSVARAMSANNTGLQTMISSSVASAIQDLNLGGTTRTGLNPNERYDIPVTDVDPSIGPAGAPITMIEFGDFRCGYCGRFAAETLEPLLAAYEGQIRFVYRDYIIFGQESFNAALAAYCAGDQGKFWEYHHEVFIHQQALNRDYYLTLAGEQGLDIAQFTSCYDNQVHGEAITADVALGQELGLTGTPTFFINGQVVNGAQPLDYFKSVIDEELASLTTG